MSKTKADINAQRRADYARANARREQRRMEALRLMSEWDGGMPPLRSMGADIGTLRGLVKDGLASELDRDRLDDPRFALTPEGRQRLAPTHTGADQ